MAKTKDVSFEEIEQQLKNKSLQQQRTFWVNYSNYLNAETELEEIAAKEKLGEIEKFKKANGGDTK